MKRVQGGAECRLFSDIKVLRYASGIALRKVHAVRDDINIKVWLEPEVKLAQVRCEAGKRLRPGEQIQVVKQVLASRRPRRKKTPALV